MKSKFIKNIITVFFSFAASVIVNAESTIGVPIIDNVMPNPTSINIKWDKIPEFHAEETIIVDSEGKPILNEDGTQQIRVFLVDQYGNKRSAESVKSQITAINAAIGVILAKVGSGALVGTLSGLKKENGTKNKLGGALVGGLVGSAVGVLASTEDIKYARAQKKSLNQQKKLLAAYEKNFTAEGVPVNAQVDISKLADLDLKPETKKSATAEQVMQELANADFNTSDTSAWEIVE